MRYSQEVIDSVRAANDIVDVISQYVKLEKKGSDYFGLCPFHSEKTGSFSVSRKKQMYYCFGCHRGGNVFKFIMDHEHMEFVEAVQLLAKRSGIALPQVEMTREQREKESLKNQLMEINKEAATYYYRLLHSDRGKHALDYFEGRALSKETMQRFGLGYSDQYSNDLYQFLRKKGYTDEVLKQSGLVTIDEVKGGHDKFWNRAMFPIMDQYSKVVAFGGRVLGEGEPKYLNSPETPVFHKSRTLYGLHLARRSRRDGMILCEGYMDVIALHQAGFDHAVASLGTALTPGHAGIIARFTKKVYLSYDSDKAGVNAALRAIPILRSAGLTPLVVHMDPYKDPDEFIKALGTAEYEKRLEEAENFFFFQAHQLEKDYDLKDPAAKTAFQQELAGMLMGFSDEMERNNYADAICRMFHIPVDTMKRYIISLAQQNTGLTSRRPIQEEEGPRRQKRDSGMEKSQMLLLSWLVDRPDLFPRIRELVGPEDFDEGLLQDVAKMLYQQMEDAGVFNPAAIADRFEDSEDQERVTHIFYEDVRVLHETPEAEKNRALVETLTKVVQNGYDKRRSAMEETDPSLITLVIEERAQIDKIKKMKIINA